MLPGAYNPELPISEADWNEYWNVIKGAMDTYIDREKVRHGLWKQYPAKDQMAQVKIKSERVLHALDHAPGQSLIMLAELDDIINYAVFTHRIINGKV